VGVGRLDDEDYPALTVGQAAEVLGVQQAFLRRLDAAGVVRSERSSGGHRRYSRRQLERAARVRELFDEGHSLAAAAHILALEDERNQAVGERDQVRDERDLARQQRDEAREQRDEAREQRDQAREQRDEAYRLLDEFQDGAAGSVGPGGRSRPRAGRPGSRSRAGADTAQPR
jgi:MerR family transcriptional regulator, heat shock protein HspR